MGKRSQQKMTGLSSENRVERSVKRKAEEEKKRHEARVKVIEKMLGIKTTHIETKHKWVSKEENR